MLSSTLTTTRYASPGVTVNSQPYLAFSPDGVLVAAGGGPVLRLWSVATGAIVGELPGDGSDVVSVAFARDGGLLAFGAESGVVRLWRAP